MSRILLRPLLIVLALMALSVNAALSIGARTETTTMIAWAYDNKQNTNVMLWSDTERKAEHRWRLFNADRITGMAFSPDGALAFAWFSPVTNVGTFPIYDWRLDRWIPSPCAVSPQWSPDSQWLFFLCPPSESPSGLDTGYIMDLESGRANLIGEEIEMWRWSPDSVYVATHPFRQELAIVNREGEAVARRSVLEFVAAWSPDGTQLAYADRDALKILDIATDQDTPLLQASINALSWSPDGEWLAYIDQTTRQAWTFHLPDGARYWLDGGDLKINAAQALAWSPDSAYLLLSDSDFNQFSIRPDNTHASQLVPGSYSATWGASGTALTNIQPLNRPAGIISRLLLVGEISTEGAFVEHLRYENAVNIVWSADGSALAFTDYTASPANQGMIWRWGDSAPRRWLDSRYSVQTFAFVEDRP